MKYMFLFLFFLNFHFDSFATAQAAASKPKVKTNENKVTDDFNKYIPFRGELESEVKKEREVASSSVGSGAIVEVFNPARNPEGLEGANPHSLEDMGRRKRETEELQFMNEYEVDYTAPGSIQHKKDIDKIVNATDIKFTELAKKMRELGLECKEVEKRQDIDSP